MEKFIIYTIDPIEEEIYEKNKTIEMIKITVKYSSKKDDIRPLLEIARKLLSDIKNLNSDLEKATEQYEKISKQKINRK